MFRMMRVAGYLIALAFVGVVAGVLLAGCGKDNPLSPDRGGIATPNFITVPQAGGEKDGAKPAAISQSFRLDHNPGGLFTFDRYTVYLPPKFTDVAGVLTLTITVPDPNVLMCDLTISPDKANKFKLPVVLTTSYAGTSGTPGSVSELWFNPTTNLWETIQSQDNAVLLTVSTSLMHFSRYALAG